MSYSFDQRKRSKGPQNQTPEPAAAPGPSMDSLMNGIARPSAAQKGRPIDLDAAMKAKMEHAFGDLSAVKLYESPTVGQAGAEAIAQGNEIAFAPGMADFSTRSGQERLGHELSHVMSQRSGEVRVGGGLLVNASLEARADREGAIAAAGQQVCAGPVTHALSSAGPSPMAAGVMQAKRRDADARGVKAMQTGGKDYNGKYAAKGYAGYEELDPEEWEEKVHTPSWFSKKFLGKNDQTYKVRRRGSPKGREAADPDWKNLSQASKSGDAESIQSAYDVIAEKQSNNVTEEQFNAVNDYITNSGPINGYLRGNLKMGNTAKKVQQTKIDLIDQVMSQNRLGGDIKAYRGVSDMALASILRQSGDKRLKKVLNKDGSINHKEFANVKDRLKGVEFTDTGFGSTSVNEQFADSWRKGIIDWEASMKVLDTQFERHKNDPEAKEMIDEMLSMKGVKSFDELKIDDQMVIKKNISLTDDYEYDEADQMKQEMHARMGSHLYEINAPKGAKATMIDRMRKDEYGDKTNAGQQEMLVGRNARYKITDILPIVDEGVVQKNQYRIIMDLLNDEEMDE